MELDTPTMRILRYLVSHPIQMPIHHDDDLLDIKVYEQNELDELSSSILELKQVKAKRTVLSLKKSKQTQKNL